jgi:hypothetical protein
MRLLHLIFVEGTDRMRRFPRPLPLVFRFRLTLLLALLASVAGLAMPSYAQTGVYAEFSTSDFHAPNAGRHNGPTFGFYHEFLRPPVFRVGADIRATLLGSGDTKAYMGFVGPVVRIHPPVFPLTPYVEGLIGAGNVHVGSGGNFFSETAFAYEGVIGLDWTILPRLDWRVVEYSAGGFASINASISPRTWSTGVVLRLPY